MNLTVQNMSKFKFQYWLFLSLLFLIFGPISIYASRLQLTLIVLFTLGAIFYGILISKFLNTTPHRWPLRNVSWPIVIFFCYLVLSSLYGYILNNSPWAIMADAFPFFEFVAFSLLTLLVVTDQKQIRFVYFILLMAFLLKALWLLYLFFTGKLLEMQLAFSEHQSEIEVGDVLIGRPFDPNISVVIPCILLYSTIFHPRGWVRWLLFGILFTFSGFVVLSFTRSIWLCIVIALFVMTSLVYMYVDKKRGLKIIGSTISLFFILFIAINIISIQGESLYVLLIDRILHSAEQLDTKLGSLRIYEIKDALTGFYQNYIFGKGMGGTIETLAREGNDAISQEKTYIHNYPIALLLKLGSIGMISLFSVLFVIIRKSLLIIKKSSSNETHFYGISFLVLLCGVLIFVNFQPIVVAYHTFALLGIVFSLMAIRDKSQHIEDLHG